MTCDEIITALEGLMEPSNDVDLAMLEVLLGPDPKEWRFMATNAHWPRGGYLYQSPTESIDAGRMLLQKAMPGFSYRICECCVSDDAWVVPDFNDPKHGAMLNQVFPEECKRDPTEWMGTDVDQRPPGRPAIALCLAIMLAFKKYQEVKEAAAQAIKTK